MTTNCILTRSVFWDSKCPVFPVPSSCLVQKQSHCGIGSFGELGMGSKHVGVGLAAKFGLPSLVIHLPGVPLRVYITLINLTAAEKQSNSMEVKNGSFKIEVEFSWALCSTCVCVYFIPTSVIFVVGPKTSISTLISMMDPVRDPWGIRLAWWMLGTVAHLAAPTHQRTGGWSTAHQHGTPRKQIACQETSNCSILPVKWQDPQHLFVASTFYKNIPRCFVG